jgi:hypothetical protein
MAMDRLCAHAVAGSCCGLGLNPETLNRASPCPSASTACGFGLQAFISASAFNANIGAWNIARVTTLNYVCARFNMGVGMTGRRGGSVPASEYIYMCVCVRSTLSHPLSIYLYM